MRILGRKSDPGAELSAGQEVDPMQLNADLPLSDGANKAALGHLAAKRRMALVRLDGVVVAAIVPLNEPHKLLTYATGAVFRGDVERVVVPPEDGAGVIEISGTIPIEFGRDPHMSYDYPPRPSMYPKPERVPRLSSGQVIDPSM